ncbi:exonuclease SbcCD subunit D [Planococcus lenghuensis]|uniref:Nuclease SbcCD subunit D n=1 Tax=Planococcus lenghuensis TaxID=2213202 RepID=A0A1Q2KW03_9BACL|nr:exonuclease SbcCD subunit D [Planococcus lenghuensis]AQQ51987.1 exonuclease sbcCD subunit D [Planococcus lenghuensis]
MRFFHTADWHLGKLVQGVYMTDDQRHVLEQFVKAIEEEKPDAVIIAGDLYDRAVPPTEAVNLLDEVLADIVIRLKTPVIAVAGNHDSPGRLDFGSRLMKANGFHMAGRFRPEVEKVILSDDAGEVHFHLVPYADPSQVRHAFGDTGVSSHNGAMKKISGAIAASADPAARHVFVGHAFVTPHGEPEENTSDSERTLSVGGAEYVSSEHFSQFQYTALGHLHQAHPVGSDIIRYAGSPLKYSISEERHEKGYYVVILDEKGTVTTERRRFVPRRDMRTVSGKLEDILKHERSDDYIFVKLLDETPVLYPMEKVRSIYPNAMHVERVIAAGTGTRTAGRSRAQMDELSLFRAFYEEVKGEAPAEETEGVFTEILQEVLQGEDEKG